MATNHRNVAFSLGDDALVFDLYACVVCGDDGLTLVQGTPDPPNGKDKVGTVICGSEECAATAVRWTLTEPCPRGSIRFVPIADLPLRPDQEPDT